MCMCACVRVRVCRGGRVGGSWVGLVGVLGARDLFDAGPLTHCITGQGCIGHDGNSDVTRDASSVEQVPFACGFSPMRSPVNVCSGRGLWLISCETGAESVTHPV